MLTIPVDVLREILEHVRKSDLATLCRVNKTFYSCWQNVLYRKIYRRDKRVIPTLARSIDLARRVRSFETCFRCEELATALQNMTSLRSLDLAGIGDDASILDGCTFKLYSFTCSFPCSESLQNFLNSQPSLTDITFFGDYEPLPPFGENCLPNLTRVSAVPYVLGVLIPGRPVREVSVLSSLYIDTTDWSFFTLSTTPIQKLCINDDMLYPKPGSVLALVFPSLVHLVVYAHDVDWTVRVPLFLST
jgi:F-box domain